MNCESRVSKLFEALSVLREVSGTFVCSFPSLTSRHPFTAVSLEGPFPSDCLCLHPHAGRILYDGALLCKGAFLLLSAQQSVE